MKPKGKILLMIDDAALAKGARDRLDGENFLFLEMSGGNVLQRVFDEVPHLILIDEGYNGGEGRLAAHHIKEDVVLKNIPIILLVKKLTFYDEHDEIIDAYCEWGSLEKLLGCVRETITQKHNDLDLNPLTRLPGTRSSVTRIEGAVSASRRFCVCCVDLSDLSAYNSAYGDARGDEIIVKLGLIIQDAVKREGSKEDFTGHLGGDDFIVLTGHDTAIRISEAIIRGFDETIANFYDEEDRRKGHILQRSKEGKLTQYPLMSVSIAIVSGDNMPRTEISEIGRIATELKKYMKSMPGSCYIQYHHHADGSTAEEENLEVCFPSKMESVKVPGLAAVAKKYTTFFTSILKRKRIQSVYQPIIDLRTKEIIGYEALTRSLDEHFKVPEHLFTLARESGRIKELDKLCVDFALKSGQALHGDRKLFLNLNHETLIDSRFMKDLFSEKGVIGYKNLVIEVTEQSILRSFDRVRDALQELKEQGVSVAIDDLGGGAVSLRDVAMLKPNYIKFDRSLIRSIDTSVTKQQIVLSLILFANGIHATTTAEGIETKREYETLLMCGIQLGQGYYFARPDKPFPVITEPK